MGNNPATLFDPTGGCTDGQGNPVPCPGGIPEAGNENLMILDEAIVTAPPIIDSPSLPSNTFLSPFYGSYSRMNPGFGSQFMNGLSVSLTVAGTFSGLKEYSNEIGGQWRGKNGKWYSTSWGGNQWTGGRSSILAQASKWRGLGNTFFVGGAVISGLQFMGNPTLEQGLQSGTDIGMGYIGTLGPLGFTVSTIYFADQMLKAHSPTYNRFMRDQKHINTKHGGATYTGSDGIYVCFAAGTMVYGENGMRPIEQVKEGDRVYSYDLERRTVQLQTVSRTYVREAEWTYRVEVGSESITVTSEHPFFVEGKGWKKTSDLSKGDRLLDSGGQTHPIYSITKQTQGITVYNIEVSGNHNYFVTVSKLLVHNKNID